MAFFSFKDRKYVPQPIPDSPGYHPPTPPTPPTAEDGSTPSITRKPFSGGTTIEFYTCTDEVNKISKTFSNKVSMTGVFKQDVDLIRPVLIVRPTSPIADHNYFRMYDRNYHVTSCVLATGGNYIISGQIDVLSTYATGIKSLDVIADKTQQSVYAVKDIDDESHVNAAGLNRQLVQFDVVEGNAFTDYPNLILITIGGEETNA